MGFGEAPGAAVRASKRAGARGASEFVAAAHRVWGGFDGSDLREREREREEAARVLGGALVKPEGQAEKAAAAREMGKTRR